MIPTVVRLCVDCKHYKSTPNADAEDGRCHHSKNVEYSQSISLVTGKPQPVKVSFTITNLYIMRDGQGMCGQIGNWYEPATLPQLIETATQPTEETA